MTDIAGAFEYTVCGRKMWFRRPIDGQLIMLQRFRMQIKGASEENLADVIMSVTTKTLNLIDSLFIDAADRDFVEEQLIAGKVGIAQLMGILTGKDTTEPADDETPAPKKRPAKKAQAAKAGNQRRGR